MWDSCADVRSILWCPEVFQDGLSSHYQSPQLSVGVVLWHTYTEDQCLESGSCHWLLFAMTGSPAISWWLLSVPNKVIAAVDALIAL